MQKVVSVPSEFCSKKVNLESRKGTCDDLIKVVMIARASAFQAKSGLARQNPHSSSISAKCKACI
jgi:hypothetical protein